MFLLSDRLNLAGLLVAPPVSGAALLVLALSSSLLVGGSLDALTDEALTLGADHVQNALERAAPHHQATLDLSPLLLAEHAVSSAVNEELLLQLGEPTLDQTGADGVNHPHLDVGGGHAQGRGDGGVGERARGGGGGQGGQSQETQLVLQGLAGLGEDTAGDGSERVGGNEFLVGIEGVRGEDLEQLEESAIAGAERLDGIGGSQGSKIEDGRAAQSGGESANSQLASSGLAGISSGNGLQSLHNVRLGKVVVASSGSGISNGQVHLLGLLLIELPSSQPRRQLFGELGLQGLERISGARLADDSHDSQEDVIPAGIIGGQSVEDGSENGDGQSRAELRRGGDGLSEIGADAREENVSVGRVVDKVNEEVVRRDDLCRIFSTPS